MELLPYINNEAQKFNNEKHAAVLHALTYITSRI